MTTTRQIVLARRPQGWPVPEDFRLETAELPPLAEGQVLVRNVVMSVDPYMRGRMDEGDTYVPAFRIDEPLDGGAVGEVVESRADGLPVGTMVRHGLGWREHAVLDAGAATVVDTSKAPASAWLGVLGMPGLTAYAGLVAAAEFQPGDAVFVSGAAGAVGSLVGQIAKALGASRVVGSAGSDEKVARVKELGFDDAFNYKAEPVADGLSRVAPEGIDVYFDNVGGDHLEAALDALHRFGRVAMCGAISGYNSTEKSGPRNLTQAIAKCLTLRGYVVARYADMAGEFAEKMSGWLADGTVHFDETFRDGLDDAPQAFVDMMRGKSTGKMVVRL